jgi:epsin
MDWNNLRDQVSNLSLYDVKASIRKVQNGRMDNGSEQSLALEYLG